MNFDYSDEQKMLKDAARRFLAVHCTVERVRAVLDNPAKSYDELLWKSMGTQGWFGAAIPERYGGLGLGRVELCAVAEELGRAIAPVPFASTVSARRVPRKRRDVGGEFRNPRSEPMRAGPGFDRSDSTP